MVTLQLQQLSVPPGHRVMLHNVRWQEFEAILEELGDHRATQLAYSHSNFLSIKGFVNCTPSTTEPVAKSSL